MNRLEAWVHSPFSKAFGWSLVHFLWEGVLIALLLAALLYLCRRGSARLRYALACLAVLAMPVALGLTFALSAPSHPAAPLLARVDVTDAGSLFAGPSSPPSALPMSFKACLPWVAPFWMAGVLVFYLRSLGSWMVAQRLRRAGVCAASSDWQARLHGLRDRLQLSKPVELLESCLVDVPVVMGFLRPVILMPMGLLAGLSTDQLESILIHELAHIRRWDYVVNLLQNLVEGLLFYHPAVWWVSGQVRAERENCCDDVVVKLKGDARGYAAALAKLEQNRWPARELALAATGGSLMKRIRRLLQEPEGHRASAAPVFVVGLLVVSLGVAVAGWQTKPSPAPKPVLSQQAPSREIHEPFALPGGSVFAPTPPIRVARDEAEFAAALAHATAPEAAPVAVSPQPKKLPVKLVAQAQPAQDPSSPANPLPVGLLTEQEKRRIDAHRNEELRKELQTPYQKWVNDDVAYIITEPERVAFKNLQTDEEREKFIEQFWLRRDPTPGTAENEFKEEHYRRIAYSNQHFASQIPGWKTDRGRIYTTYGPPDEIESHPSGAYQRPPGQGGGTTSTFPFEQWRYRYIEGIGSDITIEFVDPTMTGEYRMIGDPSEKDALRYLPGSLQDGAAANDAAKVKAGATVQVMGTAAAGGRAVLISIPLNAYGDHAVNVLATITSNTRRPVMSFEHTIKGPASADTRFVALQPGSYRLKVLVKDVATGTIATDEFAFEVK